MKRLAALTFLLAALLISSMMGKPNSVVLANQPSVLTPRNISTQDCGGVRSGGGGCFLGCCRSIAIGEDCNGNVCTVTVEVCQSGSFFIDFVGDC